jgi:hypothetical protein
VVTYLLGGADAGNYQAPVSNTYATGQITAKALSVVGLSAGSRAYDGTSAATVTGTATLTGGVTGDSVTLAGTATGTFNDKNVGAGKTVTVSGLSLGGASAGNYTLGPITLTADVTAKELRVIADNQTKNYDGKVFVGFTVHYEGFVLNETASLVTGTVTFSGAAVTAVTGGTYEILPVATALLAPNYQIRAVGGTLVILGGGIPSLAGGGLGGTGLQWVTGGSGRFSLEGTLGEAVVGRVVSGPNWEVSAGFWSALEGQAGSSATSNAGGEVGVLVVGNATPSSVGDGSGFRRLEFGPDAGTRMAMASMDEIDMASGAPELADVPAPRVRVTGIESSGRFLMEAMGGAGSVWLIQVRTDLIQDPWRTVSWIQLDGSGSGKIEVVPFAGDAMRVFRLVQWVR